MFPLYIIFILTLYLIVFILENLRLYEFLFVNKNKWKTECTALENIYKYVMLNIKSASTSFSI
jgi:hypothetical protein